MPISALPDPRSTLFVALPLLVYAVAAVVISVQDARTQRIPNRTLGLLFALQLGTMVLASVLEVGGEPLIRASTAAAVCFVGALALALLNPRGLGGGDVKLAGFVGMAMGWLGWLYVGVAMALTLILTASIAFWQVVGQRSRAASAEIALAPLVFAASWAVIVAAGVVSAIPMRVAL